jgi:hypothetical protein
MKTSLILALVCVLGLVCTSYAREVYVNSFATGANNGTTWTDAYTNLQSALPGTAGDVINVAQGTYKPSVSDPTASFTINSNVTLLGGYISTSQMFDSSYVNHVVHPNPGSLPRSPLDFLTILSGDLNGNDKIVDMADDPCALYKESTLSRADNSYSVVKINGATNVVVSGFVITGGNAIVGGSNNGGGVYQSDSTSTFDLCTFNQNYAQFNGGGVVCYTGGSITLNNCVIEQNSCYNHGGGVYVGGNPNLNHGTFNNCLFRHNTCVDGYGGGLEGERWTKTVVNQCVFDSNHCRGTWSNGGAIDIRNENYGSPDASFDCSNSVFVGNSTTSVGSTIACWASNPDTNGFTANLTNCLIANNYGDWFGDAGYFSRSSPRITNITNCTITNNRQNNNPGVGVDKGAVLNLKNTIIWGNTGKRASAQLYIDTARGSSCTINYCCIDTSDPNCYRGPGYGAGNIYVDPQFVAGDLKCNVQSSSPTIDAGDPTSDWSKEPKCNGERINMGYTGGTGQATPKVSVAFVMDGDVNCDGNVDLADFSKLASEWLQ